MRPTTTVTGGNRIYNKLDQLRRRVSENSGVFVGVPAGESTDDGTPLAVIAATHELGATINHPGGTKYIVTDQGARFVSDSYSGPIAGTTDPHTITIPERSFLRVPLRANQKEFAKVFRNQVPLVSSGEITMLQLMEQLGARAASTSQEAISSGINPPNAPSTKRKKGSSTPLVGRDGRLRQSITYVVEGE